MCESEATQAGLPGSYLALLSVTDTSPTMRDGAASLRFDLTGPIWVRPDGVALANTSAEFMNFGWLAPINQTAAGSYQIPIFTPTWVGSTAPNVGVQVASRDCNSWSDPNGSGSYSYAANDLFDAYVWPTSVLCTSPSHVFCVQQ